MGGGGLGEARIHPRERGLDPARNGLLSRSRRREPAGGRERLRANRRDRLRDRFRADAPSVQLLHAAVPLKRLLMLTSLAVAPIGAEAQQTAVVRGTVRDAATGQALEDARVAAQGSAHTVATDAAGRYTLTGIAAGQVVVRVQRFGYRAAADTLTLAPGDSVAADFALRPSALHMEPVVVTAGKRSQLLDQVVTSVALVQDSELARRAVNTVDEAVDKAPGVQFLNGQVNIRGSTGYVQGLGARVLLLVDGVPANQGDRGGINWDMLPVDQVERVEIVKGAGSALYGSAADRKSTRLNSSHGYISYAVFCLKKKKKTHQQ